MHLCSNAIGKKYRFVSREFEMKKEFELGKSAMSDEYILETNVKWNFVELEMQKFFDTSAKFGDNKRIEVIGIGQGFMSLIGRILPEWTFDTYKLPKSFIMKISASNISRRSKADENERFVHTEEEKKIALKSFERHLVQLHNSEMCFYKFASKFKLPIPTAYILHQAESFKAPGIIAMKDFADSFIIPIYEKMSIDEVKQGIQAIASVHAASIVDKNWIDYPKTTLRCATKTIKNENVILNMCKLLDEVDEAFQPRMEKLEPIFDDIFNFDFFDNLHINMDLKTVLVHGDLWSSNILWTKNGSKRELATLIDWQFTHEGCPAEDLSRLICSCLSGEVRHQKWEELVEYYCSIVNYQIPEKEALNVDEVKTSFLRLLPFQMVLLLPTLGPLVLNQVKKEHPEEYDGYRKFVIEKATALFDDLFFYHEENLKYFSVEPEKICIKL